MVDYSHVSYPSSYSYEGPLNHESPPNPSFPDWPMEWYIEMEERHYEELREHEREERERVLREEQEGRMREEQERQLRNRRNRQEHRQRSTHQILVEQEVESGPRLCVCGLSVRYGVVRSGNDIGRRHYRCQNFPNGCAWEWIDDPFPRRAVEYATELEQELNVLRNRISSLGFQRGGHN